ncbi:MAG TPA: ABC transporter substrate-binding protein [Candidatus Binatia bacterium]
MRRLSKLLLAAVVGIFVPCAAHAQTIRISYAGISGYNAPLWVAHDAGLFKKYGLNEEIILFGGGSTNIQALLANEIRFANVSGSAPIQAKLQGGEVVIIASSYNYIPYSLVVSKDISSPAELKGKRIAITRLGGITEVAALLAFEKLGLSPKDMTFVQAGPDSQRLLAVRSGAVAATIIAPPGLFAAAALGLRVLVDLGDLGVKYPTSTMITTRSYLAQNRAIVKGFLMAYTEGLHLYAQKRDFALSVTQKYTKLSDQEVLSKSHDYFVKNTSLVPSTDPAAVINALPPDKTAGRKPEEFYDNSVIQELVNEGFVEKIAKKAR